MTCGPDESDPPTDMVALSHGEHLLIWSLRRIVTGRGTCPLIAREFARLCGADAAAVLGALRAFLRLLAVGGRRRLSVGHPGWPGLTPDERLILTVIAAAQTAEPVRLEAHLRWLTRPEIRRGVAVTVGTLADALAAHGCHLPLPSPMPLAAVLRDGAALNDARRALPQPVLGPL